MSDVEFTKGPWVSVDGNTSGREVLAEKATKAKTRVARCGGPDRDANAYLIAAAPDLYGTLSTILDIADNGLDIGSESIIISMVHAALAKARGETP